MKPGFLTDSSPVEFLNQVDNNREKIKRLRRKVHVGIWILEIVYVFIRKVENVDYMVMLKNCKS